MSSFSHQAPTHQAIVIGAGFAGLSAALELARAGVQTALVDDGYTGGLITNVGLIEDPGPYDAMAGADLIGGLLGHVMEAGVDYQIGEVLILDRADIGWSLPDLGISAPTIVLATGAKLRTLNVPGEERLTGLGVSQCAFCDGALYVGQPVVVVGGGDAAYQEALHLAEIGCSVTILLRGNIPRARQAFIERAAAAPGLTIRLQWEVAEVLGDAGVEAVSVKNTQSGETDTLEAAAVFVFVGVEPQTALAPATAERLASAALTVNAAMQTSTPGIYAIGGARADYAGTLMDAAADAQAAANAIAMNLGVL